MDYHLLCSASYQFLYLYYLLAQEGEIVIPDDFQGVVTHRASEAVIEQHDEGYSLTLNEIGENLYLMGLVPEVGVLPISALFWARSWISGIEYQTIPDIMLITFDYALTLTEPIYDEESDTLTYQIMDFDASMIDLDESPKAFENPTLMVSINAERLANLQTPDNRLFCGWWVWPWGYREEASLSVEIDEA